MGKGFEHHIHAFRDLPSVQLPAFSPIDGHLLLFSLSFSSPSFTDPDHHYSGSHLPATAIQLYFCKTLNR